MRKTKIICTIGPATAKIETIRAMAEAGMNIIRLNMSHGTLASHKKIIDMVKTLNRSLRFPLSVLLDTQGPEIRTGVTEKDIFLKEGEIFTFSVGASSPEERSIDVNYDDMIHDLNVGDRVTVDNGLINLEVLEKIENRLRCRVLDGGTLGSRKHINLPGVRVNLPAITPKDKKDILFGIKEEVDYLALSFVREANDIKLARELIGDSQAKNSTKLIAKIEDLEGVKNASEIIEQVDGIMVARGDLGVEVPIEELPIIQRRLVKECALRGRRVIIATHLLESMITSPMPTRAEVTDVANAVFEEADAIMTSGETTVGKYPIKCVQIMSRIAQRVERSGGIDFIAQKNPESVKEDMARSAVQLADSLGAKCIVVVTRRGVTANLVTNFHPKTTAYAFTNMSTIRRRLALNRGMYAFRINFSSDPQKTINNAFSTLKKRDLAQVGDQVVIVSDVLAGEKRVDAVQVRVID